MSRFHLQRPANYNNNLIVVFGNQGPGKDCPWPMSERRCCSERTPIYTALPASAWILSAGSNTFLNANVTPHVREFGSIGASGDLVPLDQLPGALIGAGRQLSGRLRWRRDEFVSLLWTG